MKPSRIYLSPPHMCGKEQEFVAEAIASGWIAPIGPMVDAFEKEMCAYTGAPFAAALSSGTAAIHLALLILGVKPGDEVLCSTFTFAGSAFPIMYLGATPVFVDSEESTWNMDPQLLDRALTDRKKKGGRPTAVIVVHLYGQPADMDSIGAVCEKHGVALVEDAAESLGAFYKGKHTGTIARFGVLSFNGNKIITTSGGGMLLGHNKEDIEKARFFATQARDPAPHYEHSTIGYNYRMSNIVAAIGRGQFTAIEDRVCRKHEIFNYYRAALSDIHGLAFMPGPPIHRFTDPPIHRSTESPSHRFTDSPIHRFTDQPIRPIHRFTESPSHRSDRCNRWLTCITLDPTVIKATPFEIQRKMEAENIECRPLWKPMHMQPVFAHCPAYTNGVSEKLFRTGLCLPSGTAMTEQDLSRVVASLCGVLQR